MKSTFLLQWDMLQKEKEEIKHNPCLYPVQIPVKKTRQLDKDGKEKKNINH